MTIRRDLSDSVSGVVLLGGYVVNNPESGQNRYFVSFQEKNVARKRRPGHPAAAGIDALDTLVSDCPSPPLLSQTRVQSGVEFIGDIAAEK